MKLRIAFLLTALSGCALMANAIGQSFPPNKGPTSFNIVGVTTNPTVLSLNGQSYCTVSVDSTSTMGGATVTMKTSNDNQSSFYNVTGIPDLGSGASAAQTITAAGTQMTAPVGGKTNFEIVPSGTTSSTSITGNITCTGGSGSIAANSGGANSNVTVVAPTNGSGAVIVTTPGAAPTVSPGLFVGTTIACPSTAPAAINGAYTCTNTSGGVLQVGQAAAPSATTPVSTPSAAALPTASAGAAPPASAVQVSDFPACESSGGLAVVTGQNFLTLQCDLAGRLFVNLGDPTSTWSSTAVAVATTTVLLTGAAGQQWYIYLATMQTTGTNSGTVQWERSTSITCASGNTTLLPSAVTVDTTAGGWATLWGLQTIAAGSAGNIPGPGTIPYVLPLGQTLCSVMSGTTAVTFVTVAGKH